jgi:hypothetical protein
LEKVTANQSILGLGLLVVLLMLIFPPWIYVYHFQRPFREIKDVYMEQPAGYHAIWHSSPPSNTDELAQLFSLQPQLAQAQYFSMRLDILRLSIQIAAVCVLVGLVLAVWRGSPKSIAVFMLFMLLLLCACDHPENNKTAAGQPSPTRAAEAEVKFDVDIDPVIRTEARQAAVDYVKSKLPAATIKGVSSQPYKYNQFEVDIDITTSADPESIMVPTFAQKFFPDNAAPYWRVFFLQSPMEESIDQWITAAKLKRFNALTASPESSPSPYKGRDPLGLFGPPTKRK